MAETESYKQEREREQAKGSTAHCPVLFWIKPRAAVRNLSQFFFFKVQTPSDQQNNSEKYFCYAPRSNIVPAVDGVLCPPC